MSNFEMACDLACNNWINDVEEIDEIKYSNHHINKMKSILEGKRVLNVYFSKNVFRLIVTAAVILSLSIISFGIYEGINSKMLSIGNRKVSKDNILIIEGLDIDKASNTPVKSFEYGYIPTGYVQEDINEYDMRMEKEGAVAIRRFDFENNHLEISKYREDTIFEMECFNKGSIETFNKDGINFLREFQTDEYGNKVEDGIVLYWDVNDYVYCVTGPITIEEAIKIAKDMK